MAIATWSSGTKHATENRKIVHNFRMNSWRDRLKSLFDDGRLTMTGVSKRADLAANAVQDIYRKKDPRTPSVDNFLKIVAAAGVSPTWVLLGEGQPTIEIPVVGVISAGEGWRSVDAGLDTLTVDFKDDFFALEVKGDSMHPAYQDGDTVVCRRYSGKEIVKVIGRDCVVVTADERQLLKRVHRGPKGLFVLSSYNQRYEPESVSLLWAAPIEWIKRK
jgi:SOS-response transcriptional repressor LexA